MGWWEQGWGVASLCGESHQMSRRCGLREIRPDRVVTTTPVTCGRLGSGSGGGVVGSGDGTDCGGIAGSGGGADCSRVAGSGGAKGSGGGADNGRFAGSVGTVGRGVLDVMGAWLDIDISGLGVEYVRGCVCFSYVVVCSSYDSISYLDIVGHGFLSLFYGIGV